MIATKAALPRELLRLVAASLRSRLKTSALDAATGSLSVDEAVSRGLAAFLESHANASHAGRALNGVSHGVDAADRALGRVTAMEQAVYFEKFAASLEGGKYQRDDGTLDEAAIERRAGLYTTRLRGTANEAWALSLPDDDLVIWELGGSEESCSVCPDLAAQGPYKRAELPTFPGANETPCLFNCNCQLRSQSGTEAFKAFDFARFPSVCSCSKKL